jgi:thiol:disulfide interchange protein
MVFTLMGVLLIYLALITNKDLQHRLSIELFEDENIDFEANEFEEDDLSNFNKKFEAQNKSGADEDNADEDNADEDNAELASEKAAENQEPDEQKIVNTSNPSRKIIHNHYYGGNKEIAKFIDTLMEEKNKNLNTDKNFLVDSGQCAELNNQLATTSLAEYSNNRHLQEMKMRCENDIGSPSKCMFSPTQDQTSLLGTLLGDAGDTNFGSIIHEPNLDELPTDTNPSLGQENFGMPTVW